MSVLCPNWMVYSYCKVYACARIYFVSEWVKQFLLIINLVKCSQPKLCFFFLTLWSCTVLCGGFGSFHYLPPFAVFYLASPITESCCFQAASTSTVIIFGVFLLVSPLVFQGYSPRISLVAYLDLFSLHAWLESIFYIA